MLSYLALLFSIFSVFMRVYASFSYTSVFTERIATPIASPLIQPTPFGPEPSSAVSKLLPNITYTTYSYQPTATTTDDGTYGNGAYNALWRSVNLTFTSESLPFTTTVSPTPVPSSELYYPPSLGLGPLRGKLPNDFIWGFSGSAWQVEGALYSEGRGPALPADGTGALPNVEGQDDGVAQTMNYFLYKQDILRLAAMGVPYYTFSISWSRILPFGVSGSPVNQQGLDHYSDLIDFCLENGITPVAELWHFDTPALVNFDDDEMMQHFLYYAQVVMTHYSDRIPIWVTFNEPNIGFEYLFSEYQTINRITMAHAQVYHWYKETLNGTAQVTIKFANNMAYPLHGPENATDVAAATRYQDMVWKIMCNPIFLGQQIPESMLQTPGMNLTAFTEEQLAYINGTLDFLSIDPYSAQFATAPEGGIEACVANASHPNFPSCAQLTYVRPDGWLIGGPSQSYPYNAPEYVRQQMKYIWDNFHPSGILVAEFGLPRVRESEMTMDQQRYDIERTLYYRNFVQGLIDVRDYDGVNVIGAIAWSFVDNNEFGYKSTQFGLQGVNRTTYERFYKRSFFDFVDLLQSLTM
ncbi:hypothetical protein PFICI_09750 [Pestalotiopsis fici W106-1]|uniref:Glycoside hydrolase family 1 protein n=1 Tax=Pestalotiopsis fici (strain W106-1 / CGMCC3.15140) TaxID=1229662 RepID=W3WUZ3_PESFW|nr:uncharacterized protein PFICI_09750 [Pestalotiopsis fici W106-1]ETS77688.1 hypothetical protein PFICI_09750 [Pestalotiopsis fici W106-1]